MANPFNFGRYITSIFKWIVIVVFTFFLLIVFGIPLMLTLVGYRVNANSSEVAKQAAAIGKVELCRSIINYGFLNPQSGESRSHCVKTYASLTHDPSACELLMPSNYGWSCLGGVKSKLYEGYGCGSTDELINCSGDIHIPNQGIQNCLQYKDQVVRDWCHIERTGSLPDVHECDLVSAEPVHARDECQHHYAYKLRDAGQCASIQNEQRRVLCEMEVKYAR